MGRIGIKICPFCGEILPSAATLCAFCRKDLKSNLHVIIPDGASFSVSVKGEIALHGLKLARAREIALALDDQKK